MTTTKEISKIVEKSSELTPGELEAVTGGAFEIFVMAPKGAHALNPQPLPPG